MGDGNDYLLVDYHIQALITPFIPYAVGDIKDISKGITELFMTKVIIFSQNEQAEKK
jgi:hypothetical protein